MQTIRTSEDLRRAILELEIRRAEQLVEVKQELHQVYESVKPINLIKNTFKSAVKSPEFKESAINSALGFAAGYLSKLLFQGVAAPSMKKVIGNTIMHKVSDIVSHNPAIVRSVGTSILNLIKSMSRRRENHNHNGTH